LEAVHEQPIGFVDDEPAQVLQGETAAGADVLDQTAGRRHQHIHF
jgi:hypothetical protein